MGYQIEVSLDSEAVFNSAESESNTVHMKALIDECGFVYFHSKTLKGQLKDQALWLHEKYRAVDTDFANKFVDSIEVLFGMNTDERKLALGDEAEDHEKMTCQKVVQGIMKLGNLELPKAVKDHFNAMIEAGGESDYFKVTRHDIINAQTNIRTSIKTEGGAAKEGALFTYHTVKSGMTFHADIEFADFMYRYREEKGEDGKKKKTLACVEAGWQDHIENLDRIIGSFKRIGAGTRRGRGKLQARLLKDGKAWRKWE